MDDNIKTVLKTLDFVDWIHITQGRIQQRAHVKIVMRFVAHEQLSLFSVSYSIKLFISLTHSLMVLSPS
jgi:hypothetical protein